MKLSEIGRQLYGMSMIRSGIWLKIYPAVRRLAAGWTGLDAGLLALGTGIYLLTRLIGLNLFPIYFFTDEAVLVNSAQELLDNGLRTEAGTLLPTYMRNADRWNLGLPIYIHLASLALLGKSVTIARATSALVSLLGALAAAGALKLVFHNRFWWSAVLVLAVMPAWFIHSRTALDPVMMVAFYACFLFTYLLYRCRSPRYLYAVLVCAAATCYGYPNGQAVILVSGVLLLLSDLPYHLRQPPRLLLGAALLAGLLALPLLRFRLEQPGAWEEQLWVINSYLVQPIPVSEKLRQFASLYAQGLNPAYWFFPNNLDWERHRWYGLGHLGQYVLPLAAVGLGSSLMRWRSPAYRAVLIAVVAAPAGAALYRLEVTRALAMVVPAALLAVFGLQQIYDWLARLQRPAPFRPFALGTAGALSLLAVGMLYSALLQGPTWFTDYGLYGMQYGASQVFGAVRQELSGAPERRVLVTHTWANNPNAFIPFFLNEAEQSRVDMTTIEPFLSTRREIGEDWVFVMTASEYETALANGKLQMDAPRRVLLYPNGEPGFYFVRLAYSAEFDRILAAERALRQRLVESTAVIAGQTVTVSHSVIDHGEIQHLFDSNRDTIIRGEEANPLVLEFHFAQPVSLSAIRITGWSPETDLTVHLTPPGDGQPEEYRASYRFPRPDPVMDFELPDGPRLAQVLRLEILKANAGEVEKVHVREIEFFP